MDSTDGFDVLEDLGRIFPLVSVEDVYWRDCGILMGICLAWKFLAVLIIVKKSGRVSQIQDAKLGQEFVREPPASSDGIFVAGRQLTDLDDEVASQNSHVC